jgi:hypothetical protein
MQPEGSSAQAPLGSPFDTFEQDHAVGSPPGRLVRDRSSGIGDAGGSVKEVHLVVNPGQPAPLRAPRMAGAPPRMSKMLRDPVSIAAVKATGKLGQAGARQQARQDGRAGDELQTLHTFRSRETGA